MRRFIWVVLSVVLVFSLVGCARTKRIADDINWIVFDGEPSKDN